VLDQAADSPQLIEHLSIGLRTEASTSQTVTNVSPYRLAIGGCVGLDLTRLLGGNFALEALGILLGLVVRHLRLSFFRLFWLGSRGKPWWVQGETRQDHRRRSV
jgi:hypothetical protein